MTEANPKKRIEAARACPKNIVAHPQAGVASPKQSAPKAAPLKLDPNFIAVKYRAKADKAVNNPEVNIVANRLTNINAPEIFFCLLNHL
jgi:hypothetical protein